MSHKSSEPRIDPRSFHLPLTGVDSHAHLNGRHFDADRAEVLARARESGVAAVGNVFMGPDELITGRDMFADYPWVFFILGMHPTDGDMCTDECLERMAEQIKEDQAGARRIKAVGETGLDFYWKDCAPEVQHRVFRAHLDLAKACDLPVVIHSRDATEETFSVLEERGFAGHALLWHCFGGDNAMLRRIVDNGWHVSVPGPVTYPANAALREAVAAAPADRLLIETDCPYLTPVPYRGKRNEPAHTVFTAQAVAEARGMDMAELWTMTGDNARAFFKL